MARQSIRFKLTGKDVYRNSDYVFQEVFDYPDNVSLTAQSWMPLNAYVSGKKLLLNPFKWGASGLLPMNRLNIDWAFSELTTDGTDLFADIITSGTQLLFKYEKDKLDFVPLSVDAAPIFYMHHYNGYYYFYDSGPAAVLNRIVDDTDQYMYNSNLVESWLPSATLAGPGYFSGKYWYHWASGVVTRYDLDVYDDTGTVLFNQFGVEAVEGLFDIDGTIYIHTQDWFGGLPTNGWEHKLVGNAFVLNRTFGAGGAAQVITCSGDCDWASINGYAVDNLGTYYKPGGVVPQTVAGWDGVAPMFVTDSAIYYGNVALTKLFRWIPPAAPVEFALGASFDLLSQFEGFPLISAPLVTATGDSFGFYVNPTYSDLWGTAYLKRLAPSAYSSDFWDNNQWLRCSITPHIGTGSYALWMIIGERDSTSSSTSNTAKHLGVKILSGTVYLVAGNGSVESLTQVGAISNGTRVNIDIRKEGSTLYCYLDNVQVGTLTSGLPTGDATEDELYCVNIQLRSAATYFDVHDIRYYQDRSDDLVP